MARRRRAVDDPAVGNRRLRGHAPARAGRGSRPARWHAPLPPTLPHGGSLPALADWWRAPGDPLLVELIEAAQRESPTVASAAARIAEARACRVSAGAALAPKLDGSVSASRSNTAFGTSSPTGAAGGTGGSAASSWAAPVR